MFRIESLPAGAGDALVVEYGTRAAPRRLLVDAGPKRHWPTVRTRLVKRRTDTYEAFVVTHIDEDHIGGAVALLDDRALAPRVGAVWFNGYVHCAEAANVLGPINGEQFTSRIVQGGFPWNRGWPHPVAPTLGGPVAVPRTGVLPLVDLPGGARLVLLAPSEPQLTKLADEWEKVVTEAGLVPGAGDTRDGRGVAQRVRTFDPLPDRLDRAALGRLAAAKQSDGSVANASSICFVIEFGGKRLLLTGDAHAKPLREGIARYGALVGEERPRFDLVKLPHHGSGANVVDALTRSWTARRFLVSTDGSGYRHPDDSAIARLLLAADGARPTFYANHPGGGLARWSARAGDVDATFVLAPGPTRGITVTV